MEREKWVRALMWAVVSNDFWEEVNLTLTILGEFAEKKEKKVWHIWDDDISLNLTSIQMRWAKNFSLMRGLIFQFIFYILFSWGYRVQTSFCIGIWYVKYCKNETGEVNMIHQFKSFISTRPLFNNVPYLNVNCILKESSIFMIIRKSQYFRDPMNVYVQYLALFILKSNFGSVFFFTRTSPRASAMR